MKVILSGDPMITSEMFKPAYEKHIKKFFSEMVMEDFETDWASLQDRRLKVEQQGPEIEVVPEIVLKEGKDAELLAGLFVPVSSKLMDAMPNLKIVGLASAGKENINLKEATKRGILAFNVMGRNAEAVSDFAIGLMLSESRNIAKAHNSIKNHGWQKEFSNVDFVPQLKGKKIGIAGFGYIGRLVAQKLQGWDLEVLVIEYNQNLILAEAVFSEKMEVFYSNKLTSFFTDKVFSNDGFEIIYYKEDVSGEYEEAFYQVAEEHRNRIEMINYWYSETKVEK